jgi:hypothetical protein
MRIELDPRGRQPRFLSVKKEFLRASFGAAARRIHI